MAPSVANAYLQTRVTLMASRLLPPQALAEAIERPVADAHPLFARLRAESLLSDDPAQARRSLEQRRLSIVLDEVLILLRALSGHSRDFLLYWVHVLELVNLKTILRGRLYGRDPAEIREQLLDMGPFTALPVEALLRAESELEALRVLERTPFAEIASQALRVLEERRDLFYLDTAFDRRFYHGLVRRAERLHPHDPRGFRLLMEALIDGTNLQWLLRYRFVYGIPPAETFYLLIPARFRLNTGELKILTGQPSLEAVIARLPQPVAQWVGTARTVEEVGACAERHLRTTAEKLLARSASALTRAFAYLLLRERDLKLLRGLVRGELLGVDRSIRRQALIPPASEGGAARV